LLSNEGLSQCWTRVSDAEGIGIQQHPRSFPSDKLPDRLGA
jgi:hypothetical protein